MLKQECFPNPKENEENPYESSQITALTTNAAIGHLFDTSHLVVSFDNLVDDYPGYARCRFRAIGSALVYTPIAIQSR
jgi:hypothetical protein